MQVFDAGEICSRCVHTSDSDSQPRGGSRRGTMLTVTFTGASVTGPGSPFLKVTRSIPVDREVTLINTHHLHPVATI